MLQNSCVRVEASFFCCDFAGAHLNAAITITHCILGNLPWIKLPVYVIGQFLGSFTAAATVFGIYYGTVVCFISGFALHIISVLTHSVSVRLPFAVPSVRRVSFWHVGQTFIAPGKSKAQISVGRMRSSWRTQLLFAHSIPSTKTCPQLKARSCILSAFCFQESASLTYMELSMELIHSALIHGTTMY